MPLRFRPLLFLGLCCLAFGALFIFSSQSVLVLYSRVNLALGGLCILSFVAINARSLRAFFPGKEARRFSETTVYALLFIGTLAALNFFAYRHPVRADLTQEKVFTLSEQSKALLSELRSPITIYAFVKGGQDPRAEDLLKTYHHYNPGLVRYELVDPNQRPDLAEKYGIRRYGVFIVTDGSQFRMAEEALEESVTNAMLGLLKTRDRVVYLLEGHGERGVQDGSEEGLKAFMDQLEREGFRVKSLLLASVEKVPDDANVLAVIGPKKPFLNEEIERIKAYLDKGGKLYLCLDPNTQTNLEPFLASLGVETGNDIVIDMQLRLFQGPVLGLDPIVQDYEMHPITKSLTGRTLFSMVRSIRPKRPLPKGVSAEPIVKTSPASWAETDILRVLEKSEATMEEGKDVQGPIPIAVAWQKGDARMVVFGDSDFLKNAFFNKLFNADLALNGMNWLGENTTLLTIRPKGGKAAFLFLTPAQIDTIFVFGVLIIPQLLFALGLIVWDWRRRG